MTLQTVNIDDRTYQQLLDELVKRIPGEQWSDHNPSDPGIMLLELLSWLGEMLLFRMNRVRSSHTDRFLKLVMDPPDPVMAKITARLQPERVNPNPDLANLVVPRGVRFATDFHDGVRYVFETFQEQMLEGNQPPGMPQEATFFIRSWKEIKNEVLGVSSGLPNQEFKLRSAPVLLDYLHADPAATPPYRPNPEVQVAGVDWTLQQFLAVDGTTSTSQVFTVDGFNNVVRFGDGTFGMVPPKDADIVCTHYQVVEGPEALVKAGEIKHVLDAVGNPGETFSFESTSDAQGGMSVEAYRMTAEQRMAEGIDGFRRPFRLITPDDFENIILEDFNHLQELTRDAPFNEIAASTPVPDSMKNVARVLAVMNKKPFEILGVTQLADAPAHVTLLVVPEFDLALFNDPTVDPLTKKSLVVPSLSLRDKIHDFVETRRLITSHVNVEGLRLKDINIEANVRINSDESETLLRTRIETALYRFVNILTGFHDEKGWPFGMNLYKAQIYRLIESIPGVSHVESLLIDAPSDPDSVAFSGPELPLLASAVLQVTRVS